MRRFVRALFLPALVCSSFYSSAQQPDGPDLRTALQSTSLTSGNKSFHAVLDIGSSPSPYTGRLEVWWSTPTLYRIALTSPLFSQTEIVNGDTVQQTNQGDFYPRWLQDFRLALLDPAALAPNFDGPPLPITKGKRSCISRDDRPGGITNQLTWGNICFIGQQPQLTSIFTFNHSMQFSDFASFQGRQIARIYQTDVEGYEPVTAHLTALSNLDPSPELFTITSPTSPSTRMATAFLPTAKAESLIDQAPVIEWPMVREGKTDGYMIVYARTDRTGQVRETAKHNSDQPGLEDFGIQQALLYKFKPIAIAGIPQQMETPLVLHFTSHIADALPVLSVEDMRQQILFCPPARTVAGDQDQRRVSLLVSVDESGKFAGVAAPKTTANQQTLVSAFSAIRQCRFKPYLVQNKPSFYKGTLDVIVNP